MHTNLEVHFIFNSRILLTIYVLYVCTLLEESFIYFYIYIVQTYIKEAQAFLKHLPL